MKKLSIYVDESGVFGTYNIHEPFYIFTLIICEEKNQNNFLIKNLDYELEKLRLKKAVFHAGPIIRREKEYTDLNIALRRKIFNKMSYFANHYVFMYQSFTINRKKYYNEKLLEDEILNQLTNFLLTNIKYFVSFDTIIYYDNGQKQLSYLLRKVFLLFCYNFKFKTIFSNNSRLLQLADYVTTLELIRHKFENKSVSLSEHYFFGSYENFRKNYFRQIEKKKLKTTK